MRNTRPPRAMSRDFRVISTDRRWASSPSTTYQDIRTFLEKRRNSVVLSHSRIIPPSHLCRTSCNSSLRPLALSLFPSRCLASFCVSSSNSKIWFAWKVWALLSAEDEVKNFWFIIKFFSCYFQNKSSSSIKGYSNLQKR